VKTLFFDFVCTLNSSVETLVSVYEASAVVAAPRCRLKLCCCRCTALSLHHFRCAVVASPLRCVIAAPRGRYTALSLRHVVAALFLLRRFRCAVVA